MNTNRLRGSAPDPIYSHARLTLREVLDLTKISRSQLYLLLKAGLFPQPVRSGRSVRWASGELLNYLKQQEAAR